MDDELQRRALEIAMQHPVVVGGSLEDSWDELWLSLGEELGSELGRGTVAKVDLDVLRTGIRLAVEIERRREAGWHSEKWNWPDKKTRKRSRKRSQALVAGAALAPGEVFDVSRWVGPLLEKGARGRLKNAQNDWPRQQAKKKKKKEKKRVLLGRGRLRAGGQHPAFSVSVRDFDYRWAQPLGGWGAPPSAEQVEGTLTALGAPAICRAVCLTTPWSDLFDPGSRLPLRLALELALEWAGSYDLILFCLPGHLGYFQTHEEVYCVVHRPLSEPAR